jgi:hypothetical protein
MEIEQDDLSIRALIQAVTKELRESQTERIAAGEEAVFQVSDLTLEISFVATTSKHGGAGFDLKVVKADAGVQYDKESVQKVTLKLTAIDDQPFGGSGPFRPRRVEVTDTSGPR